MFVYFLIFSVSAFFRLFYLNLMEFKLDQALTVWQLVQFSQKSYLIQTGLVSSTGMYNFPLFNFLLLPFSLISYNPLFLTFVIAFINSVFCVVLFIVLKRFFAFWPTLLITLFISVSPWLISYSRHIWAQNLLFPFLVIFLYFLLKRSFFGLGLILSFIFQLHASGIFLLMAIVYLLNRRFWAGFAAGLIAAIPYFIFQLNTNCRDCAAFLAYSQITKHFDFNNFFRPVEIVSGLAFSLKLGQDYSLFLKQFPVTFWTGLAGVIPLILIPLLVFKVRHDFGIKVFLSIFVLIPLLYFLTKTPSYLHYYIISVPIIAVLLGYTYQSFPKLRIIFSLLMITGIIGNIVFNICFYNFIAIKKNINGDYGDIYQLTQEIVDDRTKGVLSPNIEAIKAYTAIEYLLSKN